MLHILIGGAGCGKSTCLIQHLQKQLKAGEQILTLVPEQFSYEFDQKLYRILGPVAFNQLETHSFKSLHVRYSSGSAACRTARPTRTN